MYGPTEACIDATAYPVPPDGPLPASLPIGRPLPNYRAYVLDRLGRLSPPGVPGELCLAGAGLAAGYLGRPGDTARQFVPDPFGTPGSRLYRTGDRARWRPDGLLEFLGRSDEQVKIRGFRVETGEIESCLMQHPLLRQAAVLALKDPRGLPRLGAYLVCASPAPSPDDLRSWLAQRLPDHMIPQAFVFLPSLPITPNGKLDRKALPPASFAASQRPYVPAADALEEALLQTWQDVLGLPRVGMEDDFFELGGQSLLAIRLLHACLVVARAHGLQETAGQMTLRDLMATPTPAGMAARLRGRRNHRSARLVPLREAGTRRPLFCVHPQSGAVWCFADLTRALPGDLPVWGLQARGMAEDEVPHDDMAALVADYADAMRQVQPQGPYRLLGYSSGGVAAQAIAVHLQSEGETVELLALLDSPLPQGDPGATATEAEVLADAAELLGLADDGRALRDAADLRARLLEHGLVDAGTGDQDVQRLITTARAILQLTRRHTPRQAELPLLQCRALRRDSPAADWSSTVPSGRVQTVELDADHLQLVGPAWAPTLAAALASRLD